MLFTSIYIYRERENSFRFLVDNGHDMVMLDSTFSKQLGDWIIRPLVFLAGLLAEVPFRLRYLLQAIFTPEPDPHVP